MKKTILTSILATALTTTAFAAPAPVTTIEKGQSHVQLDYNISKQSNYKGKPENLKLDGKNKYGLAMDTALSNKLALQYSYVPVKGVYTESLTEDTHTDSATYTNSFTLHQLQGIYKLDDHLNIYGGVELAKFKQELTLKRTDTANPQFNKTEVQSQSKNKTGVVFGLTGHQKLNDKLTAFASVGAGTITRYDAKLGLTYAVTKDVDFTAAYGMAKYKIAENGSNHNYLKNRGINLAVNYKF